MKTKMFTVAFIERPFMEIPSSSSVEVDLSTFYQFSNPLKVPLFSSRLLCWRAAELRHRVSTFYQTKFCLFPSKNSPVNILLLFCLALVDTWMNIFGTPSCHSSHLFDRFIKMCPIFLQRRLCIAKQSVAPFSCYLNEDRLLPIGRIQVGDMGRIGHQAEDRGTGES